MRSTRLAGSVIACGALYGVIASAQGAIIHFTNPAPGQPGHHDWHFEQVEGWQSWLDITKSASEQSNTSNLNSISQQRHGYGNIHQDGAAIIAWVFAGSEPPQTTALSYGQPVANPRDGGEFSGWAVHAGSPFSSEFAEGMHLYIGVRILGGSRGWIEVVRTGMNFTAYAWAYETEPGVPIYAGQIPAPGALALFAISAFISPSRRRA